MLRIAFLLVAIVQVGSTQEQRKADPGFVKKCTPNVVRRKRHPKPTPFRVYKGEKSTGYSPVVAYEILESGAVSNVHIKQSSGLASTDSYALETILGTQYNSRPGCGIIDREDSFSIQLSAR